MVHCSHKQVINGVCIHCLRVLEPAPSALEQPRPWTDAHRREALRRLYELAAELVGCVADGARCGRGAIGLGSHAHGNDHTEDAFRETLAVAGVDPARIDREIALVRQRAEQPSAGRTRRDTAITRLRESFVEDTGTGGDVLLVCREVEHMTRDLALAHEEIDEARALIRELRDVAVGDSDARHTKASCPYPAHPSRRTDGCPACVVLRRADAHLDDDPVDEDAGPCISCASKIQHAVGGCAMSAEEG